MFVLRDNCISDNYKYWIDIRTDNMTIEVCELENGVTKFNGTDITITVTPVSVTVKTHGVTWYRTTIRELKDDECIAYVDGWFDCIAIVPKRDGTTEGIEPVFTIGQTIRDVDLKVWDIKNCIRCGAYSFDTGVDMLVKYYEIDKEFAKKLLLGADYVMA